MPNAEEQDAIRLMKKLRANGESYRAIATELERRGIRTKEGKTIRTHTAVSRILRRAIEPAGRPWNRTQVLRVLKRSA